MRKHKYGSKCLKLPKSSRNAIKKFRTFYFRTFNFYTLQSAIVKQRYLYAMLILIHKNWCWLIFVSLINGIMTVRMNRIFVLLMCVQSWFGELWGANLHPRLTKIDDTIVTEERAWFSLSCTWMCSDVVYCNIRLTQIFRKES